MKNIRACSTAFKIHILWLLGIPEKVMEVLGSFGSGSAFLEETCHGSLESRFGRIALGSQGVVAGLLPLFTGCTGK